jgi:cellulose synthase/poly-beta-1,6-N-acetylglucosamine synthase-like glycosyltransferase
VVIAAYNAGSTLSAALASVAAQTSPPGAVVVVDDGSSDATGELAKAWSDRLPLRLVTHPANMGLAQARRSGIEVRWMVVTNQEELKAKPDLETALAGYRSSSRGRSPFTTTAQRPVTVRLVPRR